MLGFELGIPGHHTNPLNLPTTWLNRFDTQQVCFTRHFSFQARTEHCEVVRVVEAESQEAGDQHPDLVRNSGIKIGVETEHEIGAEQISRNGEFGQTRKTGIGEKCQRQSGLGAEAAVAVQSDESASKDPKSGIAEIRSGQVFVTEPGPGSDPNQDRALSGDGSVHGRDDADAADEVCRKNRRPRKIGGPETFEADTEQGASGHSDESSDPAAAVVGPAAVELELVERDLV